MFKLVIVTLPRRFPQDAKIKISRSAAKVKHAIIIFVVAFGVKVITKQRTNRISGWLARAVYHVEIFHSGFIFQQSRRQRFFNPALKTRTNFFANVEIIRHGKGHQIAKNNFAANHVVDIKSEIIGVNLNRIGHVVSEL